jgi:hypothetical protein
MILVTADLHLSDNPRDAYRHEFQKVLRQLVKQHKVETVLILGDLTEEKDHHGAWLVNRIVDHLNRLRRYCNVVIVQGNHDYVDANSPFYKFVEHIKDISWISSPMEAGQCGGGGLPALHELAFSDLGKCLLLPHAPNYKKDWHGIKLKSYDWVFTHNTFQGCNIGNGRKLSGISPNIFGKAKVISGDIHIPQKMGPGFHYVGAPYLVDFGDVYIPRVLLVSNKGKLTSLPVPGPQKRLVDITSLEDLSNQPQLNAGDILKVRFTITGELRPRWQELQGKVREWGEQNGFMIHIVQPILHEESRPGKKAAATTTKTDEQLLRTYAKHRGIDERTLKTGLNLMRRI